jgi:putative membrane protein
MNIRGCSSIFAVAVLAVFGFASCEKPGVHAARDDAPDLTGQKIVETDDETFLLNAGKAEVRQITFSQVALEKSKNDDVRAYAQAVLTDYQQALTGLKDLMKTKNIAGSYQFEATQLEARNRFEGLSGSSFDDQFVSVITAEQQAIVATLASAAETAADRDVRNYAKSVLPVLRKDFDTAVALQKKLMPKSRR